MRYNLFILVCFFLSLDLISQTSIELPIEVLGENLTIESREFDLENNGEVKDLYLLVNNFNSEGKVEIRFNNDQNWVSLTNSNTNSDIQGEAFGQIGGGYSTLKTYFNVRQENSITTLTPGARHTIHLRFNNENDDTSIGYRVVDFNIYNINGEAMINADDFEEVDPSLWEPIHDDPTSIEEGKVLWNTKNLTDNPKNPSVIKAKCASCHSVNGEDLKYFNYSNKSIIERSKFHGLTELESEKIASYIRDLAVQVPENGRPWNPPYQPGPGLDAKAASDWSAGAGLEWVLDSDKDMMPYIFQEGTSDVAMDAVFDIKGTLNIREIPIAIQFPDWNKWLPEIHPLDLMSNSAYESILTGIGGVRRSRSRGEYGYEVVKQKLEENGVAFYNDGNGEDLESLLYDLGSGVQDFLFKNWTKHTGNFPWTILESPGISQRPDGMMEEVFKRNLAKWNAVKHWEIIQKFDISGVQPFDVEYSEARQWPFNNWTVFAIAPHIVANRRGLSKFKGQADEVGLYESTAWYQLQMTLNSGMRIPDAVSAVDWSYNFDHVTKSGIETDHKEPLRLIQNLIKAYQQRDNLERTNGNDLVNKAAWNMREVSPWRLYSTAEGNTSIHETLDDYETGLWAKSASHLLKMFMDKTESLDEDNWIRSDDGDWHTIEERNYVPSNYSEEDCLFPNANGNCTDIQNAIEADAIFTVLPLLQSIDVSCNEVQRLRDWGELMWPLGDWTSFSSSCDLSAVDTDKVGSFQVYPNPVSGILNLSEKTAWELIDSMGRVMMKGVSEKIDFSNLNTSIYYLRTEFGIMKIIKK
jgi:hypothetical protein